MTKNKEPIVGQDVVTNLPCGYSGIYALELDGVIYYVGQAKNIRKRYLQHGSVNQNRTNRLVHIWMRHNIGKGILPDLTILEKTSDLDNREIYWIDYYRNIGEAKLNMADGGRDIAYLRRSKINKPWGNGWSPVQRILIEIAQCQKVIRKYGDTEAQLRADAFDIKMIAMNEAIKKVGLHKINMALWRKYASR